MNFASSEWLVYSLALAGAAGFLLIMARPNAAMPSTFLLLHFAATKFRNRSAQAMLSGEIDAQIMFELGIYALVAVIVVRCFFRIPSGQRRLHFYELLILAYLTIASVSVLWSPNFELAAVRVAQSWTLFAVAYTAVRTLTAERAWDSFVISTAGFVLLGSAISLLFPSTTYNPGHEIRRFSFFALHPLAVAGYAAIAALLIGARVLFRAPNDVRRFLRVPLWVYIPPLMTILLATRARGAIVGFGVAALILLGRKFVIGPAAHRTPLSLAVVVAWLAMTSAMAAQQLMRFNDSNSAVTTFVLRGGSVEQLLTLNGRTDILKVVWELFMEKPDFGYGFMASRSILFEKIPWAGHTHNGLAESLLNVGLIGTLVLWMPFILTLAFATRVVFRTPADRIGYPVAFLAGGVFLLFNAVVSPSFAGGPGFEFLFLVTLVGVQSHVAVKYRVPFDGYIPRPVTYKPRLPAHMHSLRS